VSNLNTLNAAETKLRQWNKTAEPTAQNFRTYAARLEVIVAKKAALRQVTKKQAAMYKTEIEAYLHNALA